MQRVHEQLGEYRLLARLAKGGQSEVFLAARSGPHGFFRPVVIKAIPDEFKGKRDLEALFYQEATISSRFSHPHVVTAHDAKCVGDEHFMVMDYVAGQTVADLAQRAFSCGVGLSLDETLLMLIDACDGLDYVHSFEDVDCEHYSIVHCDISPQNLMVTYGGITRVFDFGISQITGDAGWMKSDLIGGKFTYMSPEQCREESLDHRSDIFSLGIIFYELATGRRLFRRKSKEKTIEAITNEPIAAPSTVAEHLDADLDRIILRALERDPDDRYDRAGELEDELETLLDSRGVDREELRVQLGEKVADLFAEEREYVASILRQTREEMSEQVFAPDRDDKERPPTDREIKLQGDLCEARETITELRASAERATDVAEALTDEVTTLQDRQNWFIAGMLALSLIALAIATLAYLSHEGSFMGSDDAHAGSGSTMTVPAETSSSSE